MSETIIGKEKKIARKHIQDENDECLPRGSFEFVIIEMFQLIVSPVRAVRSCCFEQISGFNPSDISWIQVIYAL